MTYIGTNTISNAKNELAAMMHGTTLKQIQNINEIFDRGARRVITDADLWETKMDVELGTVYDNVFDYACPIDLKGNSIIDIYPQIRRSVSDNYGQTYNKTFDINKQRQSLSQFTLTSNGGQRTLRINTSNVFSSFKINPMNSVGTFTLGGSATNLRTDSLYGTIDVSSSLSFDLSAGGTSGYIENTFDSSFDLSEHLNQSMEFIYSWFPTATAISSVELRWGSDSANYWKQSVTKQYTLLALRNGWNLLGFDWKTATKVGNPDITKVKYMRTTYSYDGTEQTAIRVNDYESRLGQIIMIEYYSKYLFRDKNNLMQEKVLNDTDYVQLDTDSYDLLLMSVASEAVQQMQGLDALFFDNNHFSERYLNTLDKYKLKYRSEITKPRETYYKMPNPSRLRWIGRRWNQ